MATIRTDGFTEYPNNPANSVGKKERSVRARSTITAAANENGDVWILSGPHTYDDKIAALIGASPAFTSATDNDLGFYKKEEDGTFTEVDKDILWDGVDLSSAITYRDLLGQNASLDRDDNIGTLLGKSREEEPVGGVYLALTMNTASSAASEVLDWEVRVEEATTL